jgi:hypothetical protein
MPKPLKTEKELRALIRQRWGSPIDVTIVPGKSGYWNVLPLRTTPPATIESQVRFDEIIVALREDFDLKG